jgi:hypothetical protein
MISYQITIYKSIYTILSKVEYVPSAMRSRKCEALQINNPIVSVRFILVNRQVDQEQPEQDGSQPEDDTNVERR